jgi:hypothetical protein
MLDRFWKGLCGGNDDRGAGLGEGPREGFSRDQARRWAHSEGLSMLRAVVVNKQH